MGYGQKKGESMKHLGIYMSIITATVTLPHSALAAPDESTLNIPSDYHATAPISQNCYAEANHTLHVCSDAGKDRTECYTIYNAAVKECTAKGFEAINL